MPPQVTAVVEPPRTSRRPSAAGMFADFAVGQPVRAANNLVRLLAPGSVARFRAISAGRKYDRSPLSSEGVASGRSHCDYAGGACASTGVPADHPSIRWENPSPKCLTQP